MSIDPQTSRAKGRAALSNETGRFEVQTRHHEWDGWDIPEEVPTLRTEVRDERARRIITKNSSPDVSFDQSINPYRGCEHGCIYCFARPTHAYLGLSPGRDFETQLVARPNAAEQLEKELQSRVYTPKVIAMGTNTDPYQPIERDRGIMRDILEVLLRFRHPVSITTKGTLIERDLDLLVPLAERGLLRLGLSVTTLEADLSRKMEPRVPAPARRLATIEQLSTAGVPVHVMASPMVPGLTDHELEAILTAASGAGAVAASTISLRLPLEVAPLFEAWLREHVPDRADRVLNRVRELHGGKLYDAEWGKRFTGRGPFAALLQQRFAVACKRLGLKPARDLPELDTGQFAVPPKPGDQLSFWS